TNATAHAAATKSRRIAAVSAPGLGGSFGTVRSASGRGLRRPRPASSTSPATRESRSLATAEPLADREAQADERAGGEEPRHEPLRHGPEMAERPAAAVVRVLRQLDVADDRVELPVA